ncbi:MAG TPA: hypothetical protein PLS81_09050 [Deltaproteobacteria bacterium]|nr:hypothetical protein [Deltaproteobacteria bacterium]HPP81039.1 hypothetical protein [Deltaproteobacteria bacterium]
MRRMVFAAIAVLTVVSFETRAGELPRLYSDARVMAMGGAFVALSDDACALFYNPAGLADVKSSTVNLPLPQAEFNNKAFDMFTDFNDTDFDSTSETGSFLRKNLGDTGHAAVSFFPSYLRPRFAFGILGSARADLTSKNPVYPVLEVETVQDAAVCAGYALPAVGEDLLLGVGVKYLFRRSLDREYTVSDITSGDFENRLEDEMEEGSGALVDVGLIYKVGSFQVSGRQGTLQAGLSMNNLVGNDLGDAADIDEHLDVGFASRIGDDTVIALDYVDILGEVGEDDSVGKRIHLGVEYTPKTGLKLRLGLNQGYPTFGVGLSTGKVKLDLATYAEERGTYAGQEHDRRYIIRLGFSL